MPLQSQYPCPCCKRSGYVHVADNDHRDFTVRDGDDISEQHRYDRARECKRDDTKPPRKTGCGHKWLTWERDVPPEKGGVLRQGTPPDATAEETVTVPYWRPPLKGMEEFAEA